jgi:two-component system response regulator NreC
VNQPNQTKITVLIIDDHAMVRKGMRMLLESQPGITVVGEAATIHDAIEVATRALPTVITLDLTLPGPSGVGSVDRLRAAVPGSRVIVVTMHDDPAYVRTAMAMGASGFVHKSAADTELISAVRAVAAGRVFIDVGDAAALDAPTDSAPAGRTPLETLSERERRVLREVALGHTNQHIADEIGLSVKTVESYRARFKRKLGLKERADIVRAAQEMGLL